MPSGPPGTSPIGLGCMRLSTATDRDDARSLAVLAAALDAGVDLVDTADVYALDDEDIGHNERLIARAVANRAVTIVTKGGLTRPDGAWVPDGRAKHLDAAARASRDRLGRIDLYLLHAIDPEVPLATSVRALARLREEGIVGAIGLSNVNATQLEEALATVGDRGDVRRRGDRPRDTGRARDVAAIEDAGAVPAIAAVEVELNPWRVDPIRGGLVALCERHGIRVLAHRPLGGPAGVKRIGKDPVIGAIAARHGATPVQIVLAWLRALSPVIVPIPGATRIETAVECARVVALEPGDVDALSARFLSIDGGGGIPERTFLPRFTTDPVDASTTGIPERTFLSQSRAREIVMILGMPGSGKSTLATAPAFRAHVRLNRDERGGTLAGIARELDRLLSMPRSTASESEPRDFVLDNTYGTRAQRAPILEVARRHGAPVRGIAMATTLEQAQANAIVRILDRHGRLLMPDELRGGELGPGALFRYRRAYEPPKLDEGFASLVDEPFVPRAAAGRHAAVIVELDGIVWARRPRSVAELALKPDGVAAIAAWRAEGLVVAGTTWQTGAEVHAHVGAELGIAIACCPHPAGPPICWCRKPMPGLGLALARAHDLDLAQTIVVGRGPADRGFATRLGARYIEWTR